MSRQSSSDGVDAHEVASISAESAFAALLGDLEKSPAPGNGYHEPQASTDPRSAADGREVRDRELAVASPSSPFHIEKSDQVWLDGRLVGRIPIGMEPDIEGAASELREAVGHGYLRFRHGCDCVRCRTSYCNAVGVVALRIEGWTLEDIGTVISRTRERARQLAKKHAPWQPWKAIQAEQRAERGLIGQVRRTALCPTCGREFATGGVKRYCGADCREVNSVLRYHIDDARRLSQRTNMATWVMRNPDRVSPEHYRAAQKILEHGPDHGSGKRWLVEDTETWRVAVEACERGYPIFDALPSAIRRQVQQHLGLPLDPPDEDGSDSGITAEEALEALDAFFTDAELS